jgi:hypothetical protein
MKKILASISALLLVGFSVQAQTIINTAKNNTAAMSWEKGNKAGKYEVQVDNSDSLCYRSDTKIKKISKKKVPSEVLESFNTDFLNNRKPKWRIDLNAYAVDFLNENKENVSAYYNSKGQLLEYITLKESNTLDAPLANQINSKWNDKEVKEVMEVKQKNKTFFVVNTEDHGKVKQHYLDTEGRILN